MKTSFKEILDGPFQSLQSMEAEQKLQLIRIYEQKLKILEEELDSLIEQTELTPQHGNKG